MPPTFQQKAILILLGISTLTISALPALAFDINTDVSAEIYGIEYQGPGKVQTLWHHLELDGMYKTTHYPDGSIIFTFDSMVYDFPRIIKIKAVLPSKKEIEVLSRGASVPGKWGKDADRLLTFTTDAKHRKASIQIKVKLTPEKAPVKEPDKENPLSKLLKVNLKNIKEAQVASSGKSVKVTMPNEALFPVGTGRLNKSGVNSIRALFKEVSPEDIAEVLIEGHTDNVPIKNDTFPSNYELSAARAGAAVPVLLQLGFKPEQITTIGYSNNKPVADNATPEGRAKNRRIEFTLTQK